MKSFEYTIRYPIGIHLIHASRLTAETEKYKCRITLRKDGTEINGKTLMGIIALKVRCGETVTMIFDGPDEAEASEAILAYMQNNL